MTNKNSGLPACPSCLPVGRVGRRVKPAMTIIIEYGLYLLVFALPLGTRWIIKTGFTEYAAYSLYGTDILLFAIILIFVYLKISNNQFPITNKIPNLLITGLIATSFISVFFAIDRPLALYKFGWLTLGAGLFWLMGQAEYSKAKLVWSLLTGLALQSVLAIWQFLAQRTLTSKWLGLSLHRASDLGTSVIETVGADGVGERWLRSYAGFDHPNILGGAMAVGVLLILYLSLENLPADKSPALRATPLLKGFQILFSAALFFSFSRAAWLALGAGLGVMLVGAIMKKNLSAQKNILQTVLISGLVFFILFFQFPNLVMTRLYGGGRLENKSVSERVESIKNSLPIIKKKWAIGTGIGNYTLALKTSAVLWTRDVYSLQPAHDVFLLVFSEIGVFGFIFFIGLIIYLLMTNFQFPMTNKIPNSKPQRTKKILDIGYWDLDIGRSINGNNAMINLPVIVALFVLLSIDHWLWSLHFGVLFFWLVMGLMV